MLEEVLENLPFLLGGAIFLIGAIVWAASRQRRAAVEERVKRCAPLATFLKEISRDDIDVRRMKMLFDPHIFVEVEVATVKTMCRCVSERLGEFKRIIPSSSAFTVKKDSADPKVRRYVASATCEFTKAKDVKCEISWRVPAGTNTPKVVSFSVRPSGQELDIFDHIDAKDFERFGEKFIERLLSKNPKSAAELMHPPFGEQFKDPSTLTDQMRKVVQSIGGFKDRQFDLGLSDAKRIMVGPEGHQRKAIELEYILQGNLRDSRIKVALIFSGVKVYVLRYSFVALPVKQKMAFVDESGNPVA